MLRDRAAALAGAVRPAALYGLLRSMLTEPFVPDHATGPMSPGRPRVEQMSRTQRRRGLRVVVSDFLTPGDHELDPNVEPAWERPMRRLAVRNQVLAIEVVDPRELEFPDVGDILIRDPETGFERYVDTGDAEARAPDGCGRAAQRERTRIALRRARCGASQSCGPTVTGSPTSRGSCSPTGEWRRRLHQPPKGVAR